MMLQNHAIQSRGSGGNNYFAFTSKARIANPRQQGVSGFNTELSGKLFRKGSNNGFSFSGAL
jgi:hypothetical protein